MNPLLQKVQDLAELHAVNEINNAAEKRVTQEIESEIESDFEAYARTQYGATVATFDYWTRYGRVVRRGEKARKIEGVNVFHVTQTKSRFG
jgi:hypothetical protein